MKSLATRTPELYDKTYKAGQEGWAGIIGWEPLQETAIGITIEYSNSSYTLSYRDGSTVPSGLTKDLSGLEWSEGYPELNKSLTCINLVNKGYIKNSVCDGTLYLSYICEARPVTTIAGDHPKQACRFPFKISGGQPWRHSCVYDGGEPWCATQVGEDGVSTMTGLCQDERNTAYTGPGNNLILVVDTSDE